MLNPSSESNFCVEIKLELGLYCQHRLNMISNTWVQLCLRKARLGEKLSGASDTWKDDLMDIIGSNVFQKKLIFTNVKTAINGIYHSKDNFKT